MGRTLGHLVELTAKGRALITRTFREHAAAMEEAAGVLNLSCRVPLPPHAWFRLELYACTY
jgi:hypothetical protein